MNIDVTDGSNLLYTLNWIEGIGFIPIFSDFYINKLKAKAGETKR